ncbi:MAG: adenosylmethionine--8-amino-7-oxononanoate transaminase [Spirochaetia bacterium]|nr:adenosylmethionine--8-amino-7-oxononanoate transaminase [Spirochaetia bacterium]
MHQYWQHAWQPFTQMKLASEPPVIERGEGIYLYTSDGTEIIDAVGSWWVNIHGHSNARMNRAIADQLGKIEHVIYAGFAHDKALELSEKLSELTSHNLPRVFFSDNGSTAVEIALKMAYQYNVNAGRTEKKEFLALGGGYHGDTIGAMSVGARSVFHEAFSPLLFPCRYAEFPEIPFEKQDTIECEVLIDPYLKKLEQIFSEHGKNLCGFILEPVLQGAGGMNIYPESYLRHARKLCDQHDVFLIADEVFTGIGRTGTMFACEKAGIWPDLMALSKGLSGGYLPFAATLATEKIFQGFNSDDRRHTLFHGHSMTGSALGCAASLESLDIMKTENRLDDVKRIEQFHKNRLTDLRNGKLSEKIKEVRYTGSVGIVEFNLDQEYTGEFGWEFQKIAVKNGILLRTLGPVVYMTPAYMISDEELEQIYRCLENTASELLL